MNKFQSTIISAPVTIIPTVDQAQEINEQINLLVQTIQHGYQNATDLKDNIQQAVVTIIQNVFSTHLDIPTDKTPLEQILVSKMACNYLDRLQAKVAAQRPFPVPHHLNGNTQEYISEFKLLMTDFNNQMGQLTESLLTEIKHTKQAILHIDTVEREKVNQKSTQEILGIPKKAGPIASTSKETVKLDDTVNPKRCSPKHHKSKPNNSSALSSDWTCSRNSHLNDISNTNKSQVPDVQMPKSPVRVSHVPNFAHRQMPDWLIPYLNRNKDKEKSKSTK